MTLRIKATLVDGRTSVRADATTKRITLHIAVGKTDVEKLVNRVIDKVGLSPS